MRAPGAATNARVPAEAMLRAVIGIARSVADCAAGGGHSAVLDSMVYRLSAMTPLLITQWTEDPAATARASAAATDTLATSLPAQIALSELLRIARRHSGTTNHA